MRIAIISMQRVINYGSFLQAFALKSLLEKRGHEVKFADIEYKKGHPMCFNKNISKFKKLKNIDKYLLKRIDYSKKNKELNNKFRFWQNKYLSMCDDRMTTNGFDAVVLGSDEIFNCASNSRWGITAQRFGKIEGVEKTYTYAASCGYTAEKDLEKDDRKVVIDALSYLSGISVRDRNTYNFIKSLTNKEPCYNLDPVLVYDFKEQIKIGEQEGVPKYPYMIVYAYHNRISTKNEIKAIKSYARQKGLKTISIGGSLPWCDEFVTISPFQVLAYFKHANCIVTDTFHGTIFSVKFSKKFAVIVRDSNKNKLEDLIKRLHIEKHCINEMNDLNKVLNINDLYIESKNEIEKGCINTVRYFDEIGL